MMLPPSEAEAAELALVEEVESFALDPEGFVDFAFPWGEPGTPLETKQLRRWQRKFLQDVGRRLKAGVMSPNQVIREAIASGHGIGKSALIAMLIAWAMSTMEDTKGIITAGTEPQLKTKTWPEVCKWFNMLICGHWFTVEATSIVSKMKGHDQTWRFDRVTWNKSRTEAFAGLHNDGKRIIIIFDEASQIDDEIYNVTGGALTDEYTQILWIVFGNPTRNTGAFRRCFGSDRDLWSEGGPQQIDSRTVEGTNKEYFNDLLKECGGDEDADRFRVRARGLFPRASDLQFIDNETVTEAQRREATFLIDDPLILGIDMARGGSDNVVFRFRRGMDARSIPAIRVPGELVRDSMKLVDIATDIIKEHKPDAIFYDETGVGGPIGDRIRQLGHNIMGINFGSASPSPRCVNMRAHIWQKMKIALKDGLAIDDGTVLADDLTGVEYDHDDKDKLRLESKKQMKARGLASPDDGDALALTYSYYVAPKGSSKKCGDGGSSEYKPLS